MSPSQRRSCWLLYNALGCDDIISRRLLETIGRVWPVGGGMPRSAARIAFRQMATAWSRLAFSEELASPANERIVSASFESSEPFSSSERRPITCGALRS